MEIKELDKIYVSLNKYVIEKDGKKLIVYRPTSKSGKIYPVGLGEFKMVEDGDYQRKEYDNKYFVVVFRNGENEIKVVLNSVNQDESKDIILERKMNSNGVYYKLDKPFEIAGKKYWVNLYKNNNPKYNYDLNLVFSEVEDKGFTFVGSSEDIDFDAPF